MIKKILLMVLLLFFSVCNFSAQILVLHLADGTTLDVELTEYWPEVRFQEDKVLVSSYPLDLEYPKTDILGITYKNISTSISEPNADPKISQRNGQLIFHGVNSSDNIAVYNVKGMRIPVQIHSSGSSATLSLSSIPSGVYLLNVNGQTSKFIKR